MWSILILIFFVKLSFCFVEEDFLQLIKFDIVRVRDDKRLQPFDSKQQGILDFIGLVELHNGYKAEEHRVVTSDGYVLILHRITASPKSPVVPGKPVVFIKHGFGLSSDSFVLIGPGRDLAFLLADAGYDVWLGNSRGNTYTRSNVYVSPKKKEFWNFSYHEIGSIDLRHSIDHALKIAGKQRLIYIGYSQGTVESYVLLSTHPEYNKKVTLCISLAPIASFQSEPQPLVKMGVLNYHLLKKLSEKFHYYEFMPHSTLVRKIGTNLCDEEEGMGYFLYNPIKWPLVCKVFLNYVMLVADPKRLNTSAFPTIFTYFPAGTSIRALDHLGQNYMFKRFQMYDHGAKLNYYEYGQLNPPVYNLSRVTAPVAVFYGNKDYFTDPVDSERVCSSFPNTVLCKKVPYENFNHLDFLWARDVKELLYENVVALMNDYSNEIN